LEEGEAFLGQMEVW